MPLSAKPALLVVALAVAASLAGVAAAETPAAFAVLSAVPRPAALRSIHTVRGALQLCLAPAARAAQALGRQARQHHLIAYDLYIKVIAMRPRPQASQF